MSVAGADDIADLGPPPERVVVDVAQGNLLLDGGHLAGVIDFGTCGVGDPSCDLAVAWTLLTVDGRRVFRERLSVDDATWARGRGWALWKTLVTYAAAPADSEAAVNSRRILDEIFGEYPDGGQSAGPTPRGRGRERR
ncbi:phosphotransferase [Micromonospora sp. S-DT3-3-22]|uniref:phosphotransferase n=1 Tax=Micromonospora sp. S-DT3-3-22 TaxID=2755359 RepID=UPI001E5497FA|nr:phosphotransferase [Micromonospora sp. S-DT3-3-22]